MRVAALLGLRNGDRESCCDGLVAGRRCGAGADGLPNTVIAERADTSVPTVGCPAFSGPLTLRPSMLRAVNSSTRCGPRVASDSRVRSEDGSLGVSAATRNCPVMAI